MPVAAIAGAAAVVGGAALGASATKKASKQAAQSAADTTAANNALAREFRDENTANLAPFMQRGNAAGDAYNALLGLPTYQPPQAPQPAPQAANQNSLIPSAPQSFGDIVRAAAMRQQPQQQGFFSKLAGLPFNPQQGQPTPQPAIPVGTVQSSGVTPQSAMDGFRQYIDNSDYAFRQNEGNRGINAGYAANGLLESGAAMKALEKYRANLNAGYRGEYMGMLGNQQGIGLQGASAVAGVGQNALNTITANNNSAGSAAANAAIARGNANSNMYGQIAGGIGNLLGSSFGGGGGGQTFQQLGLPGYGLPGGATISGYGGGMFPI